MNALKKSNGLTVVAFSTHINPFKKLTDEDRLNIQMARKEKKKIVAEQRIERRASVSGPWSKDRPFTTSQLEDYNRYTHFPINLNDQFEPDVKGKEERVKSSFPKGAPQTVINAMKNYRKERYYYYLERSRARSVAPPMYVVGPAKYKGRPDRAHAIEGKAIEALNKATDILDKSIDRAHREERRGIVKKGNKLEIGAEVIAYWTSSNRQYRSEEVV